MIFQHLWRKNLEGYLNQKKSYFCQSYRQRKIGTFLWTTLYKIGLETSMRGSDFMFDCVHS